MSLRKLTLCLCAAGLALPSSVTLASDEEQRAYERSFFEQFAPQNALEMIERLPGFNLQEAGEERGLGQGGTNVLIDGQRDIGNLRTRDVSMRFRHDLPGANISYGFEFQDIQLAPVFRFNFVQFRNVPGGALSPGTNSIFLEHKNVLGLRARIEISEFLGQKSRFSREIFSGRRDIGSLDRTEARERSLNGPVITLSFGRSF